MTEPVSRRTLLPFAIVWSVIALGLAEWMARGQLAFRSFPVLGDPRVGPAGFGALATHAILCPSERRKRIVLRVGVILEILRFAVLAVRGVDIEVVAFSTGYGFLFVAVIDFLLHREWRSAALASLVPIGVASAPLGLAGIVHRLTPLTYDGALFALDGTFRIPFSELTGNLVAAVPAIRAACLISYAVLPAAIAGGLAYEEYNYRRGHTRGVGVNLLLAYTVSGTIAGLLYVLCPGTGPFYAFPNMFPDHLPDPQSVPLHLAPFAPMAPRNAMPSLHFSWGVLLWRSTAGARSAIRLAAGIFALLTLVATIGTGEHYVVDLIAAVPFIVALEAIAAHSSISLNQRITPLVAGTGLFIVWIGAVRNADRVIPALFAHQTVVWALAITTVSISALVALRHSQPKSSKVSSVKV